MKRTTDHSSAVEYNRKAYERAFGEHGEDLASLGIPKGKQDERFSAKFDIGVAPGDSVLDFGCGFGDMYPFAEQRKIDIRYTGVDITPSFIDVARSRHPAADFRMVDVLSEPAVERWDWCFVVGALNLALPDGGSLAFIQSVMQRLFEISNKGIAVDFLSSFVNFEAEGHFHADCGEMLQFAHSLSRRVVLRHDYLPYEYTLYVYKDDATTDNNSFAYHLG